MDMDYDIHVSTIEGQKESFNGLKGQADELKSACDSLPISGDMADLKTSVVGVADRIVNGYSNYKNWLDGYMSELETTEGNIGKFEAPELKGNFENIFTKVLVPAIKSGASEEAKTAIRELGKLGYYSSEEMQRLLDSAASTPSAGSGYCAAWVSNVFANAGLNAPGGNANDMYYDWCKSGDLKDLKPGMIVAVSTHDKSSAGAVYGHVGVYLGDGKIMHNIGNVETWDINNWIDYYGGVVPAQWGWVTK